MVPEDHKHRGRYREGGREDFQILEVWYAETHFNGFVHSEGDLPRVLRMNRDLVVQESAMLRMARKYYFFSAFDMLAIADCT